MNGFIIEGLYNNQANSSYVSNINPILWVDNPKESKIFESLYDAKITLINELQQFTSIISSTNICSIWILKYMNEEIVGRERFL